MHSQCNSESIICLTEHNVIMERESGRLLKNKTRVEACPRSVFRPFLMALTDLELKPGIVYYFLHKFVI